MGTRSITIMNDDFSGEEIAVLYRQYDGYPEGHGLELKDFLSDFGISNGISQAKGKTANTGACLAAQIVAHFKNEVGAFYLFPAGTRDIGEAFTYTITPKVGESINLKVESNLGVMYDGKIEEFLA